MSDRKVTAKERKARRKASRKMVAVAHRQQRRAAWTAERAAKRDTRQAARRIKRLRRRSAMRRLQRSELAQRALANLMHAFFETSRFVGRRAASRFASDFLRELGPFVPEHRIALANLAAAFPEKPPEERAHILSGAWDNLARSSTEYAFLGELVAAFDPERPEGGLIEHVGLEHAYRLRDDGKPGIIFGAHLANWELPAALSASIGLPVTAPYRPPRNVFVDREIASRRAKFTTGLVVSGSGAARQIAEALKRGEHLGIIVDQRIGDGQSIPFLERPALSNPAIGAMARLFGCPVIGCRVIRLPEGRFRLEVTPPLEFPRDSRGKIDAAAANVMVHGIIEAWIREYPEQWLWQHDRWRA